MLDVHVPHGKFESVSEFFLHLFTITVGLFIALALEGCVERIHKNEVRREAEADLRREVEDHQKKLADWRVVMQDEEKNVRLALDFLTAREQGKPGDISGIRLGYSIHNLSDASWNTALATGALSLMDYETVQDYAGTYKAQEQVMDLEKVSLDDFLILQSHTEYHFDPNAVTPEIANRVEPEARHALAHLEAMDELGGGLEKD